MNEPWQENDELKRAPEQTLKFQGLGRTQRCKKHGGMVILYLKSTYLDSYVVGFHMVNHSNLSVPCSSVISGSCLRDSYLDSCGRQTNWACSQQRSLWAGLLDACCWLSSAGTQRADIVGVIAC